MKQLKYSASQDLLAKVATGKKKSQIMTTLPKSSITFETIKQSSDKKKSIFQQPRNMFTSSDTRFTKIRGLESQNKQLQSKLTDLETDLQQIDEFRIAINLEHQPNLFQTSTNRSLVFREMDTKKQQGSSKRNYQLSQDAVIDRVEPNHNQKRIDILKAQLSKQQRYIKRLTTILQTTRHFYDELRYYLKYFSQVLSSSEQANKLYDFDSDEVIFNMQAMNRETATPLAKKEQQVINEMKSPKASPQQQMFMEDSFDQAQKANKGNQRIQSEKELLDVVDKKQSYVSLKSLLGMFRSTEEKDNFMNSFNLSYAKLIESERKNIEFNQMFEKRGNKLVFNHPIQQFLKSMGKHFPVRSIFNSFPMKEKEKMEHMLVSLEGMSSQVSRNLRKIDTFWLYKSNPYYFKGESDNKGAQNIDLPLRIVEEQEIIQEPEKYRTINLDQRMLSKVEQNLSELLDQIFELQGRYYKESLKPHFLQESSIQKLSQTITSNLESLMYITTMLNNDPQSNVNKIQIVMDDLNNAKHRYIRHQMEEKTQTPSQQDPLTYVYSFNQFSATTFDSKVSLLESLVEDLGANLSNENQSIISKIILSLRGMKASNDIQRMVVQIREAEIDFLKSKLSMIDIDLEVYKAFMGQVKDEIALFFDYIDKKLQHLQQAFTNLFDQDKFEDMKAKKQCQLLFRRTVKEVSDWVKRYLELDFRDNQINIRQIQQEFEKRVSFFYIKCEGLQRSVEKPHNN